MRLKLGYFAVTGSCFGESSPSSFTKLQMQGPFDFWRVRRWLDFRVGTFRLYSLLCAVVTVVFKAKYGVIFRPFWGACWYGGLQRPPEKSLCSTRNVPSAGTKSIDRIGKCQSSLWHAIVFASKITVHDILNISHNFKRLGLHSCWSAYSN